MKDVRELRVARLRLALKEAGGKKAELARAIGKSPAQVSQWFSGYRTIEEASARDIERKLRKPIGWLDADDAIAPAQLLAREPAGPYGLAGALATLGASLESAELTDEQRDELSDALHQLVKRRGAVRYQRLVVELLEGQHTKRAKVA